MLIDTGYRQPASNILIPFLKRERIFHINRVFISHGHKDHYGGLDEILKAGITIDEIYFNLPDKDACDAEIPWGCDYEDLTRARRLLKDEGIELRSLKGGEIFPLGDQGTLKVLYAFDGKNTPVGRTDINDTSLVMMMEHSGHRILFSGDLNQKLGKYVSEHNISIKADILKVPHHGTEGLAPNEFFTKVNARFALVPSPADLWCSERSARPRGWLENHKVPVFVNGFSGNVTVVIDEGKMKILEEKEPTKPLCSGL